MSGDAFHMTVRRKRQERLSMHNALRDAGLNAEQIQYINARYFYFSGRYCRMLCSEICFW